VFARHALSGYRIPARRARRADRKWRSGRSDGPLRRRRGRPLRVARSVVEQRRAGRAARTERTPRAFRSGCAGGRAGAVPRAHRTPAVGSFERTRAADRAHPRARERFAHARSGRVPRGGEFAAEPAAPEIPLSGALHRCTDRSGRVAAAPRALSRQLVSRCLGSQSGGVAQFCTRPHPRTAADRRTRARSRHRRTRRPPRIELRHLFRRTEGVGDDPLLAACVALGRR
jgi:hypothetical protein